MWGFNCAGRCRVVPRDGEPQRLEISHFFVVSINPISDYIQKRRIVCTMRFVSSVVTTKSAEMRTVRLVIFQIWYLLKKFIPLLEGFRWYNQVIRFFVAERRKFIYLFRSFKWYSCIIRLFIAWWSRNIFESSHERPFPNLGRNYSPCVSKNCSLIGSGATHGRLACWSPL